jgi:hypothetical protein
MKVNSKISQLVDIDPVEVLVKLKRKVLQSDNDWVYELGGRYFRGFYVSAGPHTIESSEPITKEQYDYIEYIDSVISFLVKGL